MEDREFFDLLYQHFAKTTGAENTYWMTEEDTRYVAEGPGTYNIWAVGENDERTLVALGLTEADADFLTAVHGSFPDLVRRMHDALDESDRLDEDRDNQEARIADLISEAVDRNRALAEQIAYGIYLEHELSEIQWRIDGLEK